MITTDTQTPTPTADPTTDPTLSPSAYAWRSKRILRSRNQRMLGGVAGGIAEYFGVDPTIVRLGFVVTTFFGGAGVLAYLVAWLIIPGA